MCSGLCFESKLQQATKAFWVNVHLLQVSSTFLNILTVPNNAGFCTCHTLKLIPIFSIHLSHYFDTAPSLPITTGMTITSSCPTWWLLPFSSPHTFQIFSFFRSYWRISWHCYISDLASLCIFIFHHNVWSSRLNFIRALDVEIQQYLSIPLSWNTLRLVFVPLICPVDVKLSSHFLYHATLFSSALTQSSQHISLLPPLFLGT